MQEKERKDARFLTEIRAGLTTFFTMAYIIAVNVSRTYSAGMVAELLTSSGVHHLRHGRNMRMQKYHGSAVSQ